MTAQQNTSDAVGDAHEVQTPAISPVSGVSNSGLNSGAADGAKVKYGSDGNSSIRDEPDLVQKMAVAWKARGPPGFGTQVPRIVPSDSARMHEGSHGDQKKNRTDESL